MNAAPIFDALTVLHMVISAKPSDDTKIPHSLWMKCMHAEVALRQALKEANLQIEVETAQEEA